MRFSILYLDDFTECQGELFSVLYQYNNKKFEQFIVDYMKSEIRKKIDLGIPYFLTRNGIELYEELGFPKLNDYIVDYFMPNWVGQFYSLLQWHSGIDSDKLIDIIKPDEVIARYNVLHDLDIDLSVRRFLKFKNLAYLD